MTGIFDRIRNLFGRGRITLVDDSGPVQIVQLRMNGLEVPAGRFRVPEFGFSSNPPIGSDAVAGHVAGDRSAGVVVGTNHQQSRPRGLSPGESILYSQDGKSVYLKNGAIVVEAKGQDVVVNDAANVTWTCSGDFKIVAGGKFSVVAPGGSDFDTPMLASTGDMQDNTETNSETMKAMRELYDTHTHDVQEVQGGESTIVSNVPNQQM
ncbi:phage baseplate assembly protein V [Burkholderia glumae]|uniref:phage baseplate assembly protein V n=1 Tax=Burkholderia glumae TaxID=337 RepID=UPI00039F32C8|nr:phage baseplate assembly protein V [Burkholderia glumae]MCM2493406.1 phage baseplate assembly protein V [Burkholderia glumae]MCM2547355.1 phage baseplate assembly protein V [Burkholderia glumae]UVT04573.1 phage baseplate assembly protein V [Burkholderia glumae]